MTKCVATAVMRNSGSSGRSRDVVWSMTASSGLRASAREPTSSLDKHRRIRCQLVISRVNHRTGIWREVLEFARLPLPLLRVRRGRFFDRNIWPDSREFRIQRQPFLKPRLAISLDSINWALRVANATVEAFLRVDEQHGLALLGAVHE